MPFQQPKASLRRTLLVVPMAVSLAAGFSPAAATAATDAPPSTAAAQTAAPTPSGGVSPLLQAAIHGDADAVNAALAGGAEINTKDDAGRTALMAAACFGYPQVVKLLLDKNADVNARDSHGLTALMYAVNNRFVSSKLDAAKKSAAEGGTATAGSAAPASPPPAPRRKKGFLGSVLSIGKTALSVAAPMALAGGPQGLLTQGLMGSMGSGGLTRGMLGGMGGLGGLAGMGGLSRIAGGSLPTGLAGMSAAQQRAMSAQMSAMTKSPAYQQWMQAAMAMSANPSDPTAMKRYMESMQAFRATLPPGMQNLMGLPSRTVTAAGPPSAADATSAAGWAPTAPGEQTFTLVAQTLLDHGARIDAADDQGASALTWAARLGSEEMVKLLLSRGANAGAKDAAGKTAEDNARDAGHEEIARQIQQGAGGATH